MISVLDDNLFPANNFLRFGNRKKSDGVKSGEYERVQLTSASLSQLRCQNVVHPL